MDIGMEEAARAQLILRQTSVDKKNLIQVCRLAVKTLIDKSCFTSIDGESEELLNFCAIIEQILSHRIRPVKTWLGTLEPRQFWEFVSAACINVPHSCISSIASLENVKSSKAKGRAWIRCVLMEKRLSEYVAAAVNQYRLTRKFYLEGSLMLSDEFPPLVDTLLGLNAIDFNFCLKGDNLDLMFPVVIDYSPYLLFRQSRESVYSDLEELEGLSLHSSMSSSIMSQDTTPSSTQIIWREKFKDLDQKYKNIMDQKGYLEELVRLRERQLAEVNREKQAMVNSLTYCQAESKKERQQLESIIIELQNQMVHMQKLYSRPKFQMMSKGENMMDEIPTSSIQSSLVLQPNKGLDSEQHSFSSVEGVSLPASAQQKNLMLNYHLSEKLKEDSQSLVVLAGSLTSQGSLHLADNNAVKQRILSESHSVSSPELHKSNNSNLSQAEIKSYLVRSPEIENLSSSYINSSEMQSSLIKSPEMDYSKGTYFSSSEENSNTSVNCGDNPSLQPQLDEVSLEVGTSQCSSEEVTSPVIDSLSSLCKDAIESLAERRMLDRRNENRNSLMQISNNDSSIVESIASEIILGNMDGSISNGKAIMLTSGAISVIGNLECPVSRYSRKNVIDSDHELAEDNQTSTSTDPSPVNMECDPVRHTSESDKEFFYHKQASFDSLTDNVKTTDKDNINMQRSISLKDFVENKSDSSNAMQRSITHSKGSRVSWVQIETSVGAIQIEEEMLDYNDIDNQNSMENFLTDDEGDVTREFNTETVVAKDIEDEHVPDNVVISMATDGTWICENDRFEKEEGENLTQNAVVEVTNDSDILANSTEVTTVSG
ncbi:hypothetical protein ScPMuIL_013154 [Solemya velum]